MRTNTKFVERRYGFRSAAMISGSRIQMLNAVLAKTFGV